MRIAKEWENDINDITLVLECDIVDIVFSTPYDLIEWAISVTSIWYKSISHLKQCHMHIVGMNFYSTRLFHSVQHYTGPLWLGQDGCRVHDAVYTSGVYSWSAAGLLLPGEEDAPHYCQGTVRWVENILNKGSYSETSDQGAPQLHSKSIPT